MLLGAISGFIGTVGKSLISSRLKKSNLAEFNGAETAAGMVLPAHKVTTPGGRVVGHLVNLVSGMTIGVGMSYLFTNTGKNHATLKGAGISSVVCTLLYGSYANIGGSTVRPVQPRTFLSNFIAHIGYGVITSYMITKIGSPELSTPSSTSQKRHPYPLSSPYHDHGQHPSGMPLKPRIT